MASFIVCDLCNTKYPTSLDSTFKVEFLNGEHPHAGSELTQLTDCCTACLRTVLDELDYPVIRLRLELSDAKRAINS